MMTSSGHPESDVFAEIERLKRERNAIILAHYYQDDDLQDLADELGDSLALAQKAQAARAEVIVFCGVHFMAEVAKILNPGCRVVVPDREAGCSLDEGCPADQLLAFRQKYPEHVVVTYINCSAATKAVSDVICTSSNAQKIVGAIPPERGIIFAPDRNLGAYVSAKLGRELVLWPAACIVHEQFSLQELLKLKGRHPRAKVVAHPECLELVLREADYIGSTKGILDHVRQSPAGEFIVVTEPGLIHQMHKACPEKIFYAAPNQETCGCNQCPYMRLNTPGKVLRCLQTLEPEITLDETLRQQALTPLTRMLAMTRDEPGALDWLAC